MQSSRTIGFIGLGLIGGSIAKAIRRVHPNYRLIAYNRNKSSLVAALSEGILNDTTDTISSIFSDCDFIFLCAPVSTNIQCLKQLKDIVGTGCTITDVGSVKTSIHQAVQDLNMEDCFIGGHPMAGSERSGYSASSDRLLENAYYIITPTPKSNPARVTELSDLVASMAALPIVLNYQEHDYITAAISHLPHIIAYTLVNLVKKCDNPEGMMRLLAAGGFKDITRIASSSPEMWEQICIENHRPLNETLATYMKDLTRISEAIDSEDGTYLRDFFASAREYRDDLPVSKARGALNPIYEIYLDIADESGAIATIATILATNGISIKNIGIVHNREFQEGVLKIEFYQSQAMAASITLLRKFNYTVHERN